MCLAIPGKVISIFDKNGTKYAKVDFGGVEREVCINFIEDLKIGEYVIVHAGFAINKLNEEEAIDSLNILKQL